MAMVRCPICYAQTEASAHTCIACENKLYFHKNTAYENKSLRDAVKEYDVLQEKMFKSRRTSSKATSSSTATSSSYWAERENQLKQNKVVKRSKEKSALREYAEICAGVAAVFLGISLFG
jgi:hypothetical protein|tara:strand:- start:88 stop:447 length:360 start_codon:yes stop_codon:yes gene_type:complete